MLEYMYEGWGFDTNDPRFIVSGMNTDGMDTMAAMGVLSFDDPLDVVDANEYTQIGQFVSEDGANYTDLRPQKPKCNA